MFTTKAVRILGFAGVAGVFAMLQACAPQGSDEQVDVDVKAGEVGIACGKIGEVACTGTSTKSYTPPPPSYAAPPQDYVVKWSVCTNYVEGDSKVFNNSRVVNIRPDGTVPMQRVEPVAGSKDNYRRFKVAAVTNALIRGKGFDKAAGGSVEFIKIGQVVTTKELDGSIVQWVVSSEYLGQPVYNREKNRYEYKAHCFRNPKILGKDTAGWVSEGVDLAPACVVEEMNQAWNALSAYGFTPLLNVADTEVTTYNDPATTRHPDEALYLGYKYPSWLYTSAGAALNDLNGMERDETTNYRPGEGYCHMIINGGYEVPGAKRPATKSLPAPGVVNGKTLVTWKPVNANVLIANVMPGVPADPAEPEPVEPEPEPSEVPIDAETETMPL